MKKHPRFAVVGHPNKGKSSIVSALAMDDSVQISDMPGTTQKQRSFPLKVDGKVLYELIDTPGFQRPRQVLEWLQKEKVSAEKREERIRLFINKYENDERFNDEIELLKPIVEGAGIIYIVDASKPYGQEYETEMEILRYTGQPSMALINHIEEADYALEWKRVLGQYFKMVRTFNPMSVNLENHISILESMAQLKEEWIRPVKEAIELFESYHKQMLEKSCEVISHLIYDALSYKERLSLKNEEVQESEKEEIEQKYQASLRQLERRSQKKIEEIWNHKNLEKTQNILAFEEIDLFSKEAASVFGLTRQELVVTGATSAAIAGAGIDLLFMGHTLLLGGAIGGLVGGVGAYFSFDKLSEIKLLGQKVGKHYLQMGPMQNRNFPYILLGRALYHLFIIMHRSHALRSAVELDEGQAFKVEWLNDALKKDLERYHQLFRKEIVVEGEKLTEYARVVQSAIGNIDNKVLNILN